MRSTVARQKKNERKRERERGGKERTSKRIQM